MSVNIIIETGRLDRVQQHKKKNTSEACVSDVGIGKGFDRTNAFSAYVCSQKILSLCLPTVAAHLSMVNDINFKIYSILKYILYV